MSFGVLTGGLVNLNMTSVRPEPSLLLVTKRLSG
jgi:hypothetical protein